MTGAVPIDFTPTVPVERIDSGTVPLRGVYVSPFEGTNELADPPRKVLEVPLP